MYLKTKIFCVIAMLLMTIALKAQPGKTIVVSTRQVCLVLSVGKNGRVYQTYLGKRFIDTKEFEQLEKGKHEAYLSGGLEDQFQPAISVKHADGNPSLELRFVREGRTRIDSNCTETAIVLKDPQYAVEVTIHYQAFQEENVIKTWTEIKSEESSITLNEYASGMLHFSADDYWLTHFHGDWAAEMQMQEVKLTSGIKVIESKLGTRADMFAAPMFFLALNKPADEVQGEVIAGSLAWTGNFKLHFEKDEQNDLRIIAGINSYASAYHLDKGKTFTTPAFVFTYTAGGKGQASRNLHSWVRNYSLIDGHGTRLTLLNNWETTGFNFTEKELVALFGGATDLGVDLFLLDDGWFGNEFPRNNDKAGLGDWEVNKAKLPSGLSYLTEQATAKGLKFGIWIEPEMVNPSSKLYREHPDWILKLPNRPEDYQRNQLV